MISKEIDKETLRRETIANYGHLPLREIAAEINSLFHLSDLAKRQKDWEHSQISGTYVEGLKFKAEVLIDLLREKHNGK